MTCRVLGWSRTELTKKRGVPGCCEGNLRVAKTKGKKRGDPERKCGRKMWSRRPSASASVHRIRHDDVTRGVSGRV